MPTPGEYDMPAAYGEDHPDFMRIDHAQLAEDRRALTREKAAAPSGGRNGYYQLFASTFPTGSREERALKYLAFFGGCYLNALLPPWYYRLSAAARLVALLKAECAAGETTPLKTLEVTPRVRLTPEVALNLPEQPPPPRDFHEKKIARLPYVDPSTEYARTLRHLQASDARWRAEKNRAQSYTLGTQGVGGSAGGHRPFGGVPPPPQPRLRGSGGDAPT
jgi:hypothetical protein